MTARPLLWFRGVEVADKVQISGSRPLATTGAGDIGVREQVDGNAGDRMEQVSDDQYFADSIPK
jgi:hypothetical protein